MTRNEIILGVFALVLVLCSLVVALVVPRRDPGFPGRNLRLFVVVAVLLVAAMLTAVEVFGGEHEAEEGRVEEPRTTETTGETGETRTDTAGTVEGDPAAGREVFTSVAQPPCGNCHTLEAAGTTQTLGPNLDETLADKDATFIRESVLNPDAEVAEGFPDNLMPEDYGDKLDDKQLADLVTFLVQSTSG